mmetsp:Transcript_9208/g.16101  ORF Transcript_9208/g.16101 Transcript_9208/m.16101 type:complete len:440 (+) Transcript_9208:185-1504(+)
MAPIAKPLHQGGDVVLARNLGSKETGSSGRGIEVGEYGNQEQERQDCDYQERDDHGKDGHDQQDQEGIIRAPHGGIFLSLRQGLQRQSTAEKPPSQEATKVDAADSSSLMMQEGDLLDRTFDNVEKFACSRTSSSRLEDNETYALAALSSGKQTGNAIEIFDGNSEVTPVNSIVVENDQVIKSNQTDTATAADTPRNKDTMFQAIFENVQSFICREDKVDTSAQPDTSGGVDHNGDGETPTDPQNLHVGVSTPSTPGSFPQFFESPPKLKEQGPPPRAGMLLLPDGTIRPLTTSDFQNNPRVHPLLYSRHTTPKKRSHNETPENHSIRMSRENSLFDRVNGSGTEEEEEEEDRLMALRRKKRSIENHVRTTGGSQTIVIPRDVETGTESRVTVQSPVTIAEFEREQFWKQVGLAATLMCVSFGLVLFALSFFWSALAVR